MIYYVERKPYAGTYYYYYGNHVVTFTGEVNYNDLMNSTVTSKDAVRNVKLEKQCLEKYKEFLKNNVHIRFGLRYLMYDGRPICVGVISQNRMPNYIKKFNKYFGTSSTETSDNHGIIEYTYKDAERSGDYVRILFRNNKDKKFGDGDIAMIVYLTDSGIQRFN